MFFSFIIPVFNRPQEIDELLQSISLLNYENNFEVVIVEDGSTITCKNIVANYQTKLEIAYFFKPNTGPGDSRNYGMRHAKGNYYIILDSDCILPIHYLNEVANTLATNFVHCYGGPDGALASFSTIQKAINFSMTSFLTTGGIRGGNESVSKFQPRSFNMGLSQEAFIASKGFGNIHPGEDPDLTIRLWKLGYETQLIPNAFVYHKRRIDWNKFYIQVNKFGKARPILNLWHPEYSKITYWFPTFFIIGLGVAISLVFFGKPLFLFFYGFYYLLLFISALLQTKSISVAFLSCFASFVQFVGYGTGFLLSFYKINLQRLLPEVAFPKLFFKND